MDEYGAWFLLSAGPIETESGAPPLWRPMATHGDGASAAGGERPSTAVLTQGISLVSLALQMIGEDSEVGHAPSGAAHSLLIDLKARIDGLEARLATARTEQERVRAAAGVAEDAEDAAVTEAVAPADDAGTNLSAGALAEDDDGQDFFGDRAARRRRSLGEDEAVELTAGLSSPPKPEGGAPHEPKKNARVDQFRARNAWQMASSKLLGRRASVAPAPQDARQPDAPSDAASAPSHVATVPAVSEEPAAPEADEESKTPELSLIHI